MVDMESLGADETDRHRYRFRLPESNDKLIPGMECSLRGESWEELVTLVACERLTVLLVSDRRLSASGSACLVIYPWFLYERLITSLEALLESSTHYPQSSLSVFGKHPVEHLSVDLREGHADLNGSQLEALKLCCSDSLAFVWGPPGTGKTTTLAHVVEELVSQGLRVLVTSTTNAAVDQALAALVQRPTVDVLLTRGELLRVGKSEAETYGAEVAETVMRLSATALAEIRELNRKKEQLLRLAQSAQDLLAFLAQSEGPTQLTLFEELPAQGLDASRLSGIIPDREIPAFLDLPAAEQLTGLRRLTDEHTKGAAGIDERATIVEKEGCAREAVVITRAAVIVATMAAVYVNKSLVDERFDAVVIDEAGMAVLPAVFYCASLARGKVILIGDPRQLPAIVHSSEAYVGKVMARSIFDVTVPGANPRLTQHALSGTADSARAQAVSSNGAADAYDSHLALLDLQYRMHPVIGDLVSEMYYDGRLRNASVVEERGSIAAKTPFPDAPLVLLDSGDHGRCETPAASYSRYNRSTAELCVGLAAAAIRGGLSSVAVITPYVEQSRLIRSLMAERRLREVECRTVHRFQGHEKDLIILDTVDGTPFTPGVLLTGGSHGGSATNLLNVSISRARGKLIVVSDYDYFQRNATGTPIERLLVAIAARGLVISAGEVDTGL